MTVVSFWGIIEIPYATNILRPEWQLWICAVSIALFKGGLFACLLVASSFRKWLRAIMWTLTGFYIFFCLVNVLSFIFYGFGISHRLITVVLQTNIRELVEFMPDLYQRMFSVSFVLAAAGVAAAIWLGCVAVRKLGRRLYLRALSVSTVFGFIVWSFCLLTFSSRAILIMAVRIPKNIANTIRENREYQKIIDLRHPLPYADKVESPHGPMTIVMVLGESAHRRHHRLYGYPLATTPRLSGLQDSLFVFRDVISSSKGTAGNLERILSLKKDDGIVGDWYKYPLLYDIFNAAGFRTFWLSNQERKGLFSNASGVMAEGADVVNYAGVESSEDAYACRYDDILLPAVRDALADTAVAKFIGVHLLGSHVKYASRYPESEAVFTADDIIRQLPRPWLDERKAAMIAEYDNSIRFTDRLLGEIIDICAAKPEPVVFLYFSDHGEMVYDTGDFKGRNSECVEVPFVVYANRQFRQMYPDIVDRLAGAVSLPVTTAAVPMALLTIAKIKYPLYNASDDFLSPDYVIRPRIVDEVVWEYEHITAGSSNTDAVASSGG